MKATGMIRRIDELGRIVIPKEIRKTYSIRVGDEIEIYADNDGLLVMKKHSRIDGKLVAFSGVAEAIYRSLGGTVILTDMTAVLHVSGAFKRMYEGNKLTETVRNVIDKRRGSVLTQSNIVDIVEGDSHEYKACYIAPIMAGGDVYGSLIMLYDGEDTGVVSTVVDTAVKFLALSIES